VALAHVVGVSRTDTLRAILAGNGCGVFEPDANGRNLSNANAHLPGFCINLLVDTPFSTTTCTIHIEPTGDYQAQFHWHDEEGRLTLDPVSSRTADTSSRKSISHPFAYHGLPYILQLVFQAWQQHAQ